METNERSQVRLLPKTDARPFRRGAPWAFANQLVIDRRTKAIPPGSIGTLVDAERSPLATVAINPASKIAARVLDRDPQAEIDQSWFKDRLQSALSLREQIYNAPFYRFVHAEADGLPGVVIDRFGEVAVIQPNAAWADVLLAPLVDALVEVTGVSAVVKNASGRARALEALDDDGGVIRGAVDAPVPVPMNGATYIADLLGGQKTGLFFDQRANHALAARLAPPGARS